jgi:hypothetical protein
VFWVFGGGALASHQNKKEHPDVAGTRLSYIVTTPLIEITI